MLSRRTVLSGLAGLTIPAAACSERQPAPLPYMSVPPTDRSALGLDAVIDLSHNVSVADFHQVRRHNILAVIHKATEGGDWFDPSYAPRRRQAEQAGLLWGAYHFGTRQYPGQRQAQAFLSAVQPGPRTVMALDLEPNDYNPRNTMTLPQAEAFVMTVYQATGRLP